MSAADEAVAHLLTRIAHDPRLAYFISPGTRSMELLTVAHAEKLGFDLETFRREYYATLTYEPPGSPKPESQESGEDDDPQP